jgi:fatty-acid desaturase
MTAPTTAPPADDVQPVANETRDRVITAIVTGVPILALGAVVWQAWADLLRWSDSLRWWQVDLSARVIRSLEAVGLVGDVGPERPARKALDGAPA